MRRIIMLVAIAGLLLTAGFLMSDSRSESASQDSPTGVISFPAAPALLQDGSTGRLEDSPGADPRGAEKERETAQHSPKVLLAPMAQRGQDMFKTLCIGCHSIGTHDGEAADLLNVPQTRGRPWLARWLASPEQMVKAGDPVATALAVENRNVLMPTMRLTPDDVEALLPYLEAKNQERGERR